MNLNAQLLDLDENFFDLGGPGPQICWHGILSSVRSAVLVLGHSALAAKIASELAGDFGLPVTVLDIYSHSSLGVASHGISLSVTATVPS